MSDRSDIAILPPSIVATTNSGTTTALDRYLGSTTGASAVAYRIPPGLQRDGLDGVRVIDTETLEHQPPIPAGDALTHWHVLWIRDEANASVTLASGQDEHRWPIAPGDTVGVPPGYRLTATGGQLALAITEGHGTTTVPAPDPPTHGTDHFAGYNRRTVVPAAGRRSLSRWKVTQQLDLRQHHRGDLIMVTLAGEPAMHTERMVIAPRRGQAVYIPSGSSPRLLPNGLSYVLVIAPT